MLAAACKRMQQLSTISGFVVHRGKDTTHKTLETMWAPTMLEELSPGGGGYFRNFGVGCAAGTLEPLTYTRASSAEFRYPILE